MKSKMPLRSLLLMLWISESQLYFARMEETVLKGTLVSIFSPEQIFSRLPLSLLMCRYRCTSGLQSSSKSTSSGSFSFIYSCNSLNLEEEGAVMRKGSSLQILQTVFLKGAGWVLPMNLKKILTRKRRSLLTLRCSRATPLMAAILYRSHSLLLILIMVTTIVPRSSCALSSSIFTTTFRQMNSVTVYSSALKSRRAFRLSLSLNQKLSDSERMMGVSARVCEQILSHMLQCERERSSAINAKAFINMYKIRHDGVSLGKHHFFLHSEVQNVVGSEVVVELIVLLVVAHLQSRPLQFSEKKPTHLEPVESTLESVFQEGPLPYWHLNLLPSADIIKTMQGRVGSPPLPSGILADVSIFWLSVLPGISGDVVEVDVGAGVADVAADGVGVEEGFMDLDVLEGDVSHRHSWLCLAGTLLVERVQHTSGSVPIRLLHLLGTDVDRPPDWPVHCEVLVEDVLHESGALVAGVRLHVDALERTDHAYIPKGDVSHAVTVEFWWHAAHSHAHPQDDRRVLHQKISSAISFALWLGHNHVIVILNGEVVEPEASA